VAERRGEHSEHIVDEAQAAVIRRIFSLAAEGLDDGRIVNS